MFVALYARHSTDKQAASTKDQIARLRNYCAQRGYDVAEVFTDEAKSGADIINRRGIQRLLEKSKAIGFEKVICEDLSRLSRDQSDIAWLFKRLAFQSIGIETLSEGEVNELHIGLKGTMNALYLKDLADKTHRGVMAAVKKGGVPGGKLYGYDIIRDIDESGEPIRGKRRINEAEAEIIRRIYNEYASGMTLDAICNGLNFQGVPASNGGTWYKSAFVGTDSRQTGLLRQTLYKGLITFNKMAYRKHPETGKRLAVVRPQEEWLLVPVPDLEIVDPALYDRVQEIIEERSNLREQRRLANKVVTPEEKAARENQRVLEWRARQLVPSKRTFTFMTGRMFCGHHEGEKIVSQTYGEMYRCPVKDCHNQKMRYFSELMPLAILALAKIDQKTVNAHLASPKVEAERNRIRSEINALRPQVDALRAEVDDVMHAVGRKATKEEIKGFFERKALQIRRINLDIEHLEKELARKTGPVKAEKLKAWGFMVNRLKNDPKDRPASLTLHPVINAVVIDAKWIKKSMSWRRSVRLDIDFDKLLQLKIPKGLEKDE